jgi:uncharacterized membrane protein
MANTRSSRRRGSARPKGGASSSTGNTTPSTGQASQAGGAGAPRPGPRGAAARAAEGQLPGPPAAWVQFTALGLSIAGLGMSIYLTVEHFLNGSSLACPNTGVINCAKVTSSPQSVIFGIPVPILGLVFFAWMIAINSLPAWRSPRPEVRLARLVSVIVGIGTVIYLIYAELLVIGNICLECTSIHVITFALFVLIVFSATGTRRPARRR